MRDIIHPTNRMFPGGDVIPSSDEAYQDGFVTGLKMERL